MPVLTLVVVPVLTQATALVPVPTQAAVLVPVPTQATTLGALTHRNHNEITAQVFASHPPTPSSKGCLCASSLSRDWTLVQSPLG